MTPNSTRRECSGLDVGSRCSVEVTSEENGYPIEAALQSEAGLGRRAAASGAQTIRLIFTDPQKLQRIWLMFEELENPRTQEFVLRSCPGDDNFQEIVRQQWNFSPNGSVREIEDYAVELCDVRVLEMIIVPDKNGGQGRASLRRLRSRETRNELQTTRAHRGGRFCWKLMKKNQNTDPFKFIIYSGKIGEQTPQINAKHPK
jgi:hypothetical protein